MQLRVPRTVVASSGMACKLVAAVAGLLLLAAVARGESSAKATQDPDILIVDALVGSRMVSDPSDPRWQSSPVKFVYGEYFPRIGDRVLFVDKQSVVHLGNASTTKDGTELFIRADVVEDDDGRYKALPDPVISCDLSECGLYDNTEVAGSGKWTGGRIVLGCAYDATLHLVFHAARNSWYVL